jgi:2-keto-4-pentenoate hydratase
MELNQAINLFWEATQQGIYYPPEWKGKLTVEQGYRVQLGLLAKYVKAGDRHAGWKVGLTAKAIQDQIGFHEPVFGFLLERGKHASGAVLPFEELVAPSFEAELCLTLGKSLKGPEVSREEARAAIAAVQPALEIVEKRGDFTADFPLSLADNVQQKLFVTGETTPLAPGSAPLSQATVEININGESVQQASGSSVMGDPAASVAWLANKLAEFGKSLEEGLQIMSGSFTRQFPIAQGDLIEVRFEPFGEVSAEFQ